MNRFITSAPRKGSDKPAHSYWTDALIAHRRILMIDCLATRLYIVVFSRIVILSPQLCIGRLTFYSWILMLLSLFSINICIIYVDFETVLIWTDVRWDSAMHIWRWLSRVEILCWPSQAISRYGNKLRLRSFSVVIEYQNYCFHV